MSSTKATVIVRLKREVLDPQGDAVRRALDGLGFENVAGVRIGKIVEIELTGATVFENYASDFNVPAGHPQYLGMFPFAGTSRQIETTLADCDVLLCVGAPLFQTSVYSHALFVSMLRIFAMRTAISSLTLSSA